MHVRDGIAIPESGFMHDLHKWQRHANKVNRIIPHVTEFGLAVDAGANVGLWSRMMSKHFREVWAFEPEPKNIECFKLNISNLTNVFLVERALSNTIRKINMITRGANYAREAVSGEVAEFTTDTVYLDAFNFNDLGFLKVDVDGMDLEVLEGAQQTIARCKPVICVEIKGAKAVTRPIREFIGDHGYELVFTHAPDEVYKHADQ